jgi:DNA primase
MEVSLGHLADNKVVEILQMPGSQDPDEFIRQHGKDAFVQQTRNATRLSEFLLRELVKQTNPSTAEGRAALVHAAKPLLQKVSAPILRVQLTKEIAQRAQVSQAEVEAQCGLKPLARSRYAPAQMKQRPIPSSVEYKLLQIVVHKPEWAARLPLELIDRERVEGEALSAIADAMDHGALPAGGFGMLLEFFRGTPHEALIAAIAANMVEEVDLGALEGVFNDSILRLRQTALTAEIEQLTARARQGLSQEERQRLAELLAKKHPGPSSPAGTPM